MLNLCGLQKQPGFISTFLQHGHVSLGIEKGFLPSRAFPEPTSITHTSSELFLVSAPFQRLGFTLGKQIP